MSWLKLVELIIAIPVGMGGLVAGIGYMAAQFNKGKYKAIDDKKESELTTVQLLKEQIDALEKKVETQKTDIDNLTKEVHDLRDENQQVNSKLMNALEILQGRDPHLIEFMKTAHEYILKTSPVVERLDRYLDKQII